MRVRNCGKRKIAERFIVLSIIVPAYNAEKTILRCLSSISEQNYNNYECIIVNDGSTDSTEKVISQFTEHNKKFRLINTDNGGVSRARNIGISIAFGEYITFVDSDDMLIPGSLPQLMKRMENESPDILIFGYERERADKIHSWGTLNNSADLTARIDCALWAKALQYGLLDTCWGKIYKKSTVENIKFNEQMNLGEDTAFVLSALCVANKLSFSDIKGYRHFSSPGSLDNRFDLKKPLYMNTYFSYLFSFEDRFGIAGKKWAQARNSKISKEMIRAINTLVYAEINEKETKEFLQTLLSNKKVRACFRDGILSENNPFVIKLFTSINSVSAWRLFITIRKLRNIREKT